MLRLRPHASVVNEVYVKEIQSFIARVESSAEHADTTVSTHFDCYVVSARFFASLSERPVH